MGFFEWFCDVKKKEIVPEVKLPVFTTPQTRTLSNKKKPSSKLSLKDYVGQQKAKAIIEAYVSNKNILPHIIIHGNAGCGKTTLARIIAKEKGCKFVEIMSKSIENGTDLCNIITASPNAIVFIDELHGLKRDWVELIYMMMEDFTFNGNPIKPFTLIGATTEYGELLKSRRPFIDRFKINIELETYTSDEIELIIKNHANRAALPFLSPVALKTISVNSKLVPRTAIRLIEATVAFHGDYKTALSVNRIIKDGLTDKDVKTLTYLANIKVAGCESISSYLNTPKQSYLYEVEPYLLQTGFIVRVAQGRKITQAGIDFLKTLP
jgi:Holliday junction DNA helicase RuvB